MTELLNSAPLTLEEAIIDLYLTIKIRKNDDIHEYTFDQYKQERERLKTLSPFMILGYIQSTIEILLSMKPSAKEEEQKTPPEELADTYESMLQKMEAEVEQQLKLHAESIKFLLDEAEKENDQLKAENKKLYNSVNELKGKVAVLQDSLADAKAQIAVKTQKITDLSLKVFEYSRFAKIVKGSLPERPNQENVKLSELFKLPSVEQRKFAHKNRKLQASHALRYSTITPSIGETERNNNSQCEEYNGNIKEMRLKFKKPKESKKYVKINRSDSLRLSTDTEHGTLDRQRYKKKISLNFSLSKSKIEPGYENTGDHTLKLTADNRGGNSMKLDKISIESKYGS